RLMSVTTSYPGIYIQELPSSSHAIQPAPTSITAFVGYSHPYKTQAFDVAQQIFSFSDYETYFGGLFSSGLIDASLARAVYQFFLNGGSNAYVVGLQPGVFGDASHPVVRFGTGSSDMAFHVTISSADATPVALLLITALDPTDVVPMAVQITNVKAATASTPAAFDLIVTHGTRVETYRGGQLTDVWIKAVNGASALISIAAQNEASWGGKTPAAGTSKFPTSPTNLPAGFDALFSSDDFLNVFLSNSSLDNVEIFNLLLVPGVADNSVVSAALAFAERKRAFAILDPPPQAPASGSTTGNPKPIQEWMTGLPGGYILPQSQNGALYFPYLVSNDPVTGNNIPMPPSGFVAGQYAQTDANRGVWKAPAGLANVVLNTAGPVPGGIMNDPQQGVLNLDSINCLRSFSGIGTVLWGARTLVAANPAYQQSAYVPVRRMTLFIEQSLLASLRWVVFEPNDEPLWTAIKSSIESFLLSLFRQGALQGATPSDAFQVKCDATTTTPDDQASGRVIIVVAFAPLKPAEFVIIKIAQLAGQTAGA
ncbi:MAG TPA: phage tail sheath subtilisin-like domain-containing protein, partial [Acetobacteraceae bacterium]|nr:phage tail sheath subtilisin-like domain-containing protein [Acetobacteraceae bacterium]